MKTIEMQVYRFDELSETAKRNARCYFYDHFIDLGTFDYGADWLLKDKFRHSRSDMGVHYGYDYCTASINIYGSLNLCELLDDFKGEKRTDISSFEKYLSDGLIKLDLDECFRDIYSQIPYMKKYIDDAIGQIISDIAYFYIKDEEAVANEIDKEALKLYILYCYDAVGFIEDELAHELDDIMNPDDKTIEETFEINDIYFYENGRIYG